MGSETGATGERARHAASRGDWNQAYDLLLEAQAGGRLTPADMPFLAEVAYAAGHLDVTIETWEAVHAEGVRTGDSVAAAGAAVRVAMHLLFDTALMAPVRGWLSRAESLLEGEPETPVHAWLAVVRNYERMMAGDFESARRWARRAIEIGSSADPAAAAVGRVAEARNLILEGEVRQGLALLDEAGVATVSGELDPLSTGIVYCELVCALQGLSLYDLAEEWTEAMERWRRRNAIGSLHGRCRVHRAEILRLRGSYNEAEKEALVACEELRPYLRREFGWPLNEVGRIRLRMGDIDGADEAFLAAQQAGWDPQPGLALVHLGQGNVALAVASVRDALENPLLVPSKELPPNSDLRRAPLLEAQVEIEIAAHNIDRARSAADELEQVADRFQSKALSASAALARGRVRLAQGRTEDAKRRFQEAAHLWDQVGAPYEASLARHGLAEAEQSDRAGEARLEKRPDGPPAQASNVFRLEGDYWSVVFDDRTVRVRDLKGMRYLARLLGDPGREFHVLDLVAAELGRSAQGGVPDPGLSPSFLGDAGEILDARAKEAYRRRLAEIEEDLEEARAIGDAERAAQAGAERDFLVRELAHAVGLGGRDRRAGSASERARASVTRAVRQAMARISQHHSPLGKHLDRTVRTGTYCAYLPDPRTPVDWEF
jgi:tetratricopeptide (TPR) repeat protein